MKNFRLNHYERAFGNWLIDNHIQYIAVDEQKRAAFGRSKIKSFDYLLYPRRQHTNHQTQERTIGDSPIIVAEVKGRKFKGTTLAKLAGFECWVTIDDIEGLTKWQETFGPTHIAAFVFAYKIENIDVDFDGHEVYDFDANKYVFFCITLKDYCAFMKIRSGKWRTVTLPAEKFRNCAVQIRDLLL